MKIISKQLLSRLVLSSTRRLHIDHLIPDKQYIQLQYRWRFNKRLDLNNPLTFSEKLQWLKLYNRQPEYSMMVDKYAVKKYVAEIVGEKYIIPTLGVWDKPEDIEWDKLPDQFVLKCTHDSGGLVICHDKLQFDKGKAIKKLSKCLKANYYWPYREWPYKKVKPRIIAEKFIVDESGKELKDYKIFCFDGIPKIIQVDYDRFVEHKRNLYDTGWHRLPLTIGYPSNWNREFEKPQGLDKMLEIASLLSTGYPHLRVDLYNMKGNVLFGELTFFHGSGFEKFSPDEWDYKFGEWITLPQVKRE